MKRLLAALLTFSMIVSIVPFSAFADSPDTVVSPNVSAAAQNTSTPTLDADTIQAINSDPLLQGQYLSETSQPTVDTSDVTMEATDGFGRLLLNSINEQNDASSNRIIGVSVSGNTATVEYVSTTDADIVVSIYTDDSAEEMVASGTAYAPAMVENTGSSTATVAISGTIPEYYTVKCYLLDTAEHAPLCKEYTDDSNTEDIVDLETATIDSFPQDRVINLDDQSVTNFAVVKKGILLINDDSSDAHADSLSENHTVISENGNGSYTIHTSDSRIKSLVPGKILTYQSGDEILIIRVETISVSDDSITITGDDSLDLIDVFDIVKLESSNDDGQLEYDGSGVDKDVHYNGATKDDDELEQTNAFSDDVNFTFTHKFVIGTDTFYDGKKEDDDGAHAVSKFGINAVLNLKLSNQFKYYISATKQTLDYSLTSEASGGVEVAYTGSIKIDLGYFKKKLPGIYINYTPQLVMQTDVKGQFLYTVTSKQGFHCDGFSITDTSQKPVVDFSIKVSGTIYIGVEFAPSVKAGVYKISKPRTDENFLTLMELKLTFSIGAEGSLTPNVPVEPVAVNQISHKFSGNSIHECNACLAGDVYSKVVFSVTVNVIKIFDQTATLLDYRQHILTLYYSINYNDLGFGTCPHNLYLVDITVDAVIPPSGSEVIDGEGQSIGTLSASDKNYCYMRPGTYTLETTIDGNRYSHTFTVGSSNIDVKLTLNGGSSGGGSSGGGSSDPSLWALDENGKLTINNETVMTDYNDAASTPWYSSRDKITYILTQYMVKKISSYAFADCNKVTTVQIGDDITEIGDYAFSGCISLEKVVFAGTMAKWKEMQIGIGNDILNNIEIICTDGSINTKDENLIIASGECGSNGANVIWILNKSGNLEISGTGSMKDYSNNTTAPWYKRKGDIKSVTINRGVINVGSFAFFECYAIKDISICSTVTSIGDAAFLGCCGIKSITLPNNVAVICNSVFAGCDGLEEIILSNSVTRIEFGAFQGCKSLKNITIPDTVTYIGSEVFRECLNLTNITLPFGITEINSGLFSGCYKLANVFIPTSVTTVGNLAFTYCKSLEKIDIPLSVTSFGATPFYGCNNLTRINYSGTRYQWHNQVTGCQDCFNTGAKEGTLSSVIVYCTDGYITSAYDGLYPPDYHPGDLITLSTVSSEENSIFPSTATGDDHSFAASFSDLTPGVSYSVIISKSDTDPLAPENLIYINQFRASSSDYQQSFQTPRSSTVTENDMFYVVAAGSRVFEDTSVNPGGGGSSSGGGGGGGGGSSGGGGGGGGAAVLIGVGAAAAITAGVIMMSPVDVKGRVVLADQAAVPGAKISLLQDGKVVEQTTADDAGAFALKVKRGNYQLTAAYTDANGQIIHQTIDIKAPAKDLVVTF